MYHQVNHIINNNNNNNCKTSSSTSTASSISSASNTTPFQPGGGVGGEQLVYVQNEAVRVDQLPPNVRDELSQLELELLEGDLTQKGYDKKKTKLLMPYLTQPEQQLNLSATSSTTTTAASKFTQMRNFDCKRVFIFILQDNNLRNLNYGKQQQMQMQSKIPVLSQQANVNEARNVQQLRKNRRKNKDDPNVNRYHSGSLKFQFIFYSVSFALHN